MSDPHEHVFWLDGAPGGMSGHWVRATSLNTTIPQWIAKGIRVVGIRIHPDNGNNIDLIINREDVPSPPLPHESPL